MPCDVYGGKNCTLGDFDSKFSREPEREPPSSEEKSLILSSLTCEADSAISSILCTSSSSSWLWRSYSEHAQPLVTWYAIELSGLWAAITLRRNSIWGLILKTTTKLSQEDWTPLTYKAIQSSFLNFSSLQENILEYVNHTK